jgi:hypothetical protein
VSGGLVRTADDVLGALHEHEVKEEETLESMFDLTQEVDEGVCLKQIEIWAVLD